MKTSASLYRCFLVVRAVIVARVVAVGLFQVLEAVPVSGLRDYAVVLWLFLARPLSPIRPPCLNIDLPVNYLLLFGF